MQPTNVPAAGLCVLLVVCLCAGLAATAAAQQQPQRAFLDQYCVTCHNQRLRTAELELDSLNLTQIASHAETWEKVVRKLRTGMMPPSGARRPDGATRNTFAAWLETQLDRTAAANPNPGRPALHRLNRTEYQNAIRDLLALEVDAASLLPPDDSTHGFDNVAASLGVSPALLEGYLSAAVKVSRLAVGSPSIEPTQDVYRAPAGLSQNVHVEGLPFGTRGGMVVRHHFPLDGEYSIRVRLMLAPAQTRMGASLGGEQIEVVVDGERVRLFDVDRQDDLAGVDVRIPVRAGTHTIGAAFLARNIKSDDSIRPYLKTTLDPTICIQAGWTCLPHIGTITVTGPLAATGPGDTPSRRKVFVCRPARLSEEAACAKEIIATLARQAYRRPVTDEDLESLMEFYQAGRRTGKFEDGIETALERILASPEFVFRVGPEPANVRAGQAYRISDVELASRLSFFLWSTIPDGELLTLARQNKLRDPAVLEKQVRRMLADGRSGQFVTNFAGQWLYLRNLDNVTPSTEIFPDFDENLRAGFRRETELLFESIIREDRNVVDLLNADYTFVNERVARHYGIPNVYGSHFRRVALGQGLDARRGLLGHGSILTVTSYPNRTSPVSRGKWILENILGSPPPEPPPVVPEFKEQTREDVERGNARSVRARLEEHRTNPTCAGCHKIMDPIGFSLEYFDAVGKWRTRDEAGTAIDAGGELVDGTKVDSPASLRQALLHYSSQFVATMTEKLMVYALGRGVEYYDMPVVRSITREAAASDYRFSSIIMGIVKSAPFQMKIKERS
jgi:mono/diheme cytochrome c family protein